MHNWFFSSDFLGIFLPYSKHGICFCGAVKREQRTSGGGKGNGIWHLREGRKNKEENYLFENSEGEHSHCWVMNKSL